MTPPCQFSKVHFTECTCLPFMFVLAGNRTRESDQYFHFVAKNSVVDMTSQFFAAAGTLVDLQALSAKIPPFVFARLPLSLIAIARPILATFFPSPCPTF